jgi:hypothetical protein
MNATSTPERVSRSARLKWVPIRDMKVSALAQRDLNTAWVDRIANEFNVEQIGTPTVNLREGNYYVIDGQHRVAALKQIGWGDQQIQCWTYEGLSEAEEAEMFLRLSDTLGIKTFDKFRIGMQAGRDEETDIDRVVRANGLVVSKGPAPNGIQAVATLRRVYRRSGPNGLGRTLRLVRDAYGEPGLEAAVIDGLGLVCHRYNGELNDAEAVKRLGNVHGGVNGLLGKAENLRRTTGRPKPHCVAAAAVEIINQGRGGKKLPSWWKVDEAAR